jgi:hypothetical protein
MPLVTTHHARVADTALTMLASHVGIERQSVAVRDLYADTVKTSKSLVSMQTGSVTGSRSEHITPAIMEHG